MGSIGQYSKEERPIGILQLALASLRFRNPIFHLQKAATVIHPSGVLIYHGTFLS